MTREDNLCDSSEFRHGMDVGISLGLMEAYDEALVLYKAGAIDFWFEWQRPKSLEDWDTFHHIYGSDKELREKYGLPPRK